MYHNGNEATSNDRHIAYLIRSTVITISACAVFEAIFDQIKWDVCSLFTNNHQRSKSSTNHPSKILYT